MEEQAVVAPGFMSIIDKAASMENIDIGNLERMMALQLQWEAREAKKSFDAAMTRISAKLADVRITKSKSVGYDIDKNDKSKGQKEAFRYATFEDIDKIVRPILNEEQMAVSYDTEPSVIQGWHTIIVKLSHAGHTESSKIPLPLDNSGGKNNVQGMGSAYSYGKRYALCAALNIVTVGEDDDGAGGAITEEQAAEIKTGFRESGMDVAKFLKTLKVENVESIRTKDYARVVNAIKAKKFDNMKKEEKNAKVS